MDSVKGTTLSSFEERLKQAREHRAMSVREVEKKLERERQSAEDTDIQATNLTRYEDGERSPRVATVITLCQIYQVNPMWLMLGVGPMELSDALRTGGSVDARYVIERVERTTREIREQLQRDDLRASRDKGGPSRSRAESLEGNGPE